MLQKIKVESIAPLQSKNIKNLLDLPYDRPCRCWGGDKLCTLLSSAKSLHWNLNENPLNQSISTQVSLSHACSIGGRYCVLNAFKISVASSFRRIISPIKSERWTLTPCKKKLKIALETFGNYKDIVPCYLCLIHLKVIQKTRVDIIFHISERGEFPLEMSILSSPAKKTSYGKRNSSQNISSWNYLSDIRRVYNITWAQCSIAICTVKSKVLNNGLI